MSWFALAPTIVIALVLAVAVLVRSGTPGNGDVPNGANAVQPSGPIPTFGDGWRQAGSLLRDARKPVWPINHREFNARVRRGFKLAGVMAMAVMVVYAARSEPNSMGGVLLLAGILLGGSIAVAFACIASVIHSIILQILPYRGPIASTALGGAMGFTATLFWGAGPDVPHSALILAGVIYGLLIGVIESSGMTAKTHLA